MDFYSNLAIFYQTSLRFGGRLTSCVAVLDQNTCVWDCRPVLYYFKVNISLLERFMKPGMGIMAKFLLQRHHFPPSHSPQFCSNLGFYLVEYGEVGQVICL